MSGLAIAITVIGGWILSVCLHEFGHAIVAYWGGDTTVKEKGYLTLNPLKYTDIGYSLVLPVVFLMLGGIALPGAAVYINTGLLRGRGWKSAVSAAGPFMTGLVAIALALPFQLGWATQDHWFWQALALLTFYQVAGLCFNLCPIPSFDGFGIIEPWLPHSLQAIARRWGRYGYLALFAILWTVPAANETFWMVVKILSYLLGIPDTMVTLASAGFANSSKVIFVPLLFVALLFRKVWGDALNQPSETANVEMNLAAYDRLIQDGQATPEIWQSKGEILQSLEHYEEAITCFDAVLKAQPNSAYAWHCRAICWHNLHQYEAALVDYDQALKYQPADGVLWVNKAQALNSLGQIQAAVLAYDVAIKSQPKELEYYKERGDLLFKLQDYANARINYEHVLKYQPNHPTAWEHYIWILEHLNEPEVALDAYQQALRYQPKNGNLLINKAVLLKRLNRHAQARLVFEQIQTLPLAEPLRCFQKGTAYFYSQDYDNALICFDQYLALQGDPGTAHYNKACCYALQGKPDLAIESLAALLDCEANALFDECLTDPDLQSLLTLDAFQPLTQRRAASIKA